MDIPFVWEVDSKEGFRNFAEAYKRMSQQRRLPLQHNIKVTSAEREAVGNTYYVPICNVDFDSSYETSDDDQELFRDFMAWVENFNRWVLSEWENHHVKTVSEEDKDIADSIVNIDIEED